MRRKKTVDTADDKRRSGILDVLASVLDEWRGRIAADHPGWRCVRADRARHRAGAAADVEPVRTVGDAQPRHKPRCEQAAPPAHEGFVSLCGSPSVANFLHASETT